MLASRLDKIIPFLIHPDQTGFLKGRLASDNSRMFSNILTMAGKFPHPLAALSLDAEKAFDRVNWKFMLHALQWLGFGPNFISYVKLLYTAPKACVFINGLFSSYFCLQRGTRQGCPLSPLLFLLCLEPFLQRIRDNPFITGFKLKSHHIKLSAYADDILIYMSNPTSSIPPFLQEISTFSTVSGYKLNFSKT